VRFVTSIQTPPERGCPQVPGGRHARYHQSRYPGHQIRPDECTSLIAIPAQANQVFLKYRLRSPLGRTGSARRPKLSLAFSGQPSEVPCAQCSYRDKPESASYDSTVVLGAVSWFPAGLNITLFSDISLHAIRDFNPDSLLNEVVRKFS
jgi:hypothetical protein